MTGGILVVKTISTGAGTAAFNFGGGTLQASGALSTTLPMTLTGAGGNATVDTAGYAVTLSGQLSGPGGLDKLDTGTLTLSGANTYGGLTTVSGGTLDLVGTSSAVAWNPVLFGAGAEVDGGQLIFDYSGGAADPETTIAALLGSKIYTTIAGDRASLFDNTVTDQVVLSLVAVPEPSYPHPPQPVEKGPQVAHASIEILGKNVASSAGKTDFFNRLLGIGATGLLDFAWRRRRRRGRCLSCAAVVVAMLIAGSAQADVFNMGGTRNPTTGTWTGLASLEFVTVGNPGNAADTGNARRHDRLRLGGLHVPDGQVRRDGGPVLPVP